MMALVAVSRHFIVDGCAEPRPPLLHAMASPPGRGPEPRWSRRSGGGCTVRDQERVPKKIVSIRITKIEIIPRNFAQNCSRLTTGITRNHSARPGTIPGTISAKGRRQETFLPERPCQVWRSDQLRRSTFHLISTPTASVGVEGALWRNGSDLFLLLHSSRQPSF